MRLRVTTRGRVTLPKAYRDLVGLEPGSEVEVFAVGDDVHIVPRDPVVRKRIRALAALRKQLGEHKE